MESSSTGMCYASTTNMSATSSAVGDDNQEASTKNINATSSAIGGDNDAVGNGNVKEGNGGSNEADIDDEAEELCAFFDNGDAANPAYIQRKTEPGQSGKRGREGSKWW